MLHDLPAVIALLGATLQDEVRLLDGEKVILLLPGNSYRSLLAQVKPEIAHFEQPHGFGESFLKIAGIYIGAHKE